MEETQNQVAPKAEASEVEKYKVIAALAYIIFFLPMVTDAKDSKFAMFHANQGLLVLIVSIASWAIALIPVLGWIASPILGLVAIILAIVGILNALNGKMTPLPVIGNYNLINK